MGQFGPNQDQWVVETNIQTGVHDTHTWLTHFLGADDSKIDIHKKYTK